MFKKNLITTTDSYKISHHSQFPAGTEATSYYIEAREENSEIIVAGLNYVAKVIEAGITEEDVTRAAKLFKSHFGQELFHYDGWMRIVNEFDGKLPLSIVGAREGTLVPTQNVIAIVENTHPDFWWLPGHLETFILRSVWYMTTVATKSFRCKRVIKEFMDQTSCLEGMDYEFVLDTRLHDFGARGATSSEAAGLGGLAHLYNFIGTDNVESLIMAQDLYDDECAGVSIPAREHSTVISYLNEDDAYRNSIEQFGAGVYAVVLDSTDYNAAVDRVCNTMVSDIKSKGGTFVVRPDSGDIVTNVMYALDKLGKSFGYTRNEKGYKVLHSSVRIIQGDDINNEEDIYRVLNWMAMESWSAENVAFGMGGGLLQKVNRDTHKFAMKMSAIMVNGEWRGVSKCPKGSEWKASKKGLLDLVIDNGEYKTIDVMDESDEKYSDIEWILSDDKPHSVLHSYYKHDTYYDNGIRVQCTTLEEVRANINKSL